MKSSRQRNYWLQVAKGQGQLNNIQLNAGDGIAITNEDEFKILGKPGLEVLLFDMRSQ